ncbi:sugar transporter [Verticillium alfalfae VaMs.102]|uniref:Sugar transporter n=1 Tax=Verticillium alfalfae (strain VaMs.102 / ATCC MYA-4576 / FGSC 10136) TaxID=526221 RepID=C9SEU5_VERA1|nr:sugar transporter [Verticillium alfalfae VaMs.102]EEY16688.1 sugar transporter [Verticillium alfalfae VaMs.102]
MDKQNPEVDMVEGRDHGDEKSQGPFHEALGPMRAKSDDLSVWATMRLYKVAGIIAMAGAFSASLDGYQINLNGGIVSNKGFIKQMAGGGKKIIAGRYISAWGGIQSAGQTIGQLLIQYVTEAYGRKVSLLIILAMFITSVMTESFANNWQHWLVAKLLSGMGVGMLQCTMPLYLAEVAPTQLRGVFINAYTFWFVLGQLFASVALYELKAADPTDYKTPIYTQWAMVGVAGIIFILLPESPWWLVSKGRFEKASKSLQVLNRGVEAFDVQEHINVMNATIQMENDLAAKNKEEDMWEVFRGRNLIRFIICSWPKVTQQFVGLAVFNTYATYFCNPICRQQESLPRDGHPVQCPAALHGPHIHSD